MSNTRKPRTQPVDFDKLSVQRGRVLAELKPIKIAGNVYRLPPKISLAASEKVEQGSAQTEETEETGKVSIKLSLMAEVLAELFGPEQWEKIKHDIDYPDVPFLFGTVFDMYRESVGEASPSGDS